MTANMADKITKASENAAQLIKTTAENTAMALNIQYIQRDIVEIKAGQRESSQRLEQALKEINAKDELFATQSDYKELELRVRSNEVSITRIMTYGTAALVILGIAEFILNQYLSRN